VTISCDSMLDDGVACQNSYCTLVPAAASKERPVSIDEDRAFLEVSYGIPLTLAR